MEVFLWYWFVTIIVMTALWLSKPGMNAAGKDFIVLMVLWLLSPICTPALLLSLGYDLVCRVFKRKK